MWDKIKQAPAVITIIVALFQAVKNLVIMMEEEGPEEGGGKEKKEVVLDLIEVIYDLVNHWIPMPFEKDTIMGAVERVLEIIVKFKNILGLFKKDEGEEEDYMAKAVVTIEEEETEDRKISKLREFTADRLEKR